MPWDFGAGDVIAGLRLAYTIYEIGFVAENSADVRYRTFQNDILNFRQLLERLDRSLQNAQRRYDEAGIHHRAQAIEPLSEDFERERITIIGNFIATLEECDALLKQNKELRQKYSNVVDNLRWHLSQQEQRVDDLRRRLHSHAEKIRLVIDRLSIDLLKDIDAKVDDILGLAEQNIHLSNDILLELNHFRTTLFGYLDGRGSLDEPRAEDAHVASPAIAQRFSDGLTINPPRDLGSGIPLVEGFDALFSHFEQSVKGLDQKTPEKYLMFLKTRWLLAQIKSSRGYRNARPGFYYRRAINQIEQGVAARARASGDLVAYDDAALLTLPESSFLVWPPAPAIFGARPTQPHPLSIRANEQEVLRLRLASDGDREPDVVTIFKHSHEHFRIVLETRSAQDERVVIPQAIYTAEDSLIPRYALPSLISPSLEIATFSRRFGEETLYKLGSYQDVWDFQKAFTGYDVSHDQLDITCQLSNDVSFLDCTGRIQLWQDPIVFQNVEQNSPSIETRQGRSFASTGPPSSQQSSVPSAGPTNTICKTTEGWQADNIKLPALTVFTQFDDKQGRSRFAMIFVKLTADIEVSDAGCRCHVDYDACSKLVLVRQNKKRFPVRIQYSELDSQGSPDPNTFDLLPFRLPRHSKFSTLAEEQTDYVLLRFSSLDEKKLFHRELNLRFNIRARQVKDQNRFSEALRVRQDRPMRNAHSGTLNENRRPSLQPGFAPVRRVQTLPPHVEMPDSGPSFGDSFSHGTDPRPIRGQTAHGDALSRSTSQGTSGSRSTSIDATTNTDSTGSDLAIHTERHKSVQHDMPGQIGAIFPRNGSRSQKVETKASPLQPRCQAISRSNVGAISSPGSLEQRDNTLPATILRRTSWHDTQSPLAERLARRHTESDMQPELRTMRRDSTKKGKFRTLLSQM